jgi:hypothetical protein
LVRRPRGHSEASHRGWENSDHEGSGWYGDPRGHSEASRRGWDDRDRSSRSSSGRHDDDDRRSRYSRDDDDDRGGRRGGATTIAGTADGSAIPWPFRGFAQGLGQPSLKRQSLKTAGSLWAGLRGGAMTRIEVVRRAILLDLAPWHSVVGAMLALAVPTILRWWLDGLANAAPYVLYCPFILFAAVFLGWRAALAVAAIATLVVNALFPGPLAPGGLAMPVAHRTLLAALFLVVDLA